MSTETISTGPTTDTGPDFASGRLDSLASDAAKAIRQARDNHRYATNDCETLLSAVDHTLAADAVRRGVFYSIQAAAEFAQDQTAADWEYCPEGPCGQLLNEVGACIRAVEDVHFAALRRIVDATASIVGPRDPSADCNDPLNELNRVRDKLAKVVATFKPAKPDRIGPDDDLPF